MKESITREGGRITTSTWESVSGGDFLFLFFVTMMSYS